MQTFSLDTAASDGHVTPNPVTMATQGDGRGLRAQGVAVSETGIFAAVSEESSSLTGDFVFHPGKSVSQGASATPASRSDSGYEALFWETIKESKNPEDFHAYLRQYPHGAFASLAHIRISTLEEGTRRTEPRSPGDARLKVALLPFDGWHGGGKLSTALENIEKGVTDLIQDDPRLDLVYAYQRDSSNPGPSGAAEHYWEGANARQDAETRRNTRRRPAARRRPRVHIFLQTHQKPGLCGGLFDRRKQWQAS